jgi:hypothetical protein
MIPFGPEICGNLAAATQPEWLDPPCPLPSIHCCIFGFVVASNPTDNVGGCWDRQGYPWHYRL